MAIALAVDATTANTTASQESAVAKRPMTTPAVAGVALVDLRSSTKLTYPSNDCVSEQSPLVEVGKQRRKCLIGGRDQVILQAGEIVAMRVPKSLAVVVPVDADERYTVLYESPCQQHALPVDVAPVTIANGCRFLRQVECLPRGGRTQQVERLLLEPRRIDGIDAGPLAVNLRQKLPPGVQALIADIVG